MQTWPTLAFGASYLSMHEQADCKGDIEATLWLNFRGLHGGGCFEEQGVSELYRMGGGVNPASQSPENTALHKTHLLFCVWLIS